MSFQVKNHRHPFTQDDLPLGRDNHRAMADRDPVQNHRMGTKPDILRKGNASFTGKINLLINRNIFSIQLIAPPPTR